MLEYSIQFHKVEVCIIKKRNFRPQKRKQILILS